MRAGLLDGLLAWLAGALLGPLRELPVAPRLVGIAAAWIEGAARAVAICLATRATIPQALSPAHRIGAGAAALALMLGFGAAFGLFLAAIGLAGPRGLPELWPGFLLLGWLLAAPLLRAGPKPRPG